MIDLLAATLIVIAGLYLVGLGVALLFAPDRAIRFLGGFASSAGTHYLELVLRLVAGIALVRYASQMLFSGFFSAFGWMMLATTIGLFAVPWQWHHRFAERVVPQAVRHATPVACVSLALGGIFLASVVLGPRA